MISRQHSRHWTTTAVLLLCHPSRSPFRTDSAVSMNGILKWTLINSRSVCNKLNEFYHLLYGCSFDVVFVTESWLTCKFPNSLLDPNSKFTIFRHDRQHSRGGGVCILVSKRLMATEVILSNNCDLEMCCVDIHFSGTTCRAVVVYRAPNDDSMPNIVNQLSALLDVRGPCIVAGDFNCGNINWYSLESPKEPSHELLLKFCVSHGLAQVVATPTRGNNILDLVLTNEPLCICNMDVTSPFGNSDHCQVEFATYFEHTIVSQSDNACRKVYDWDTADFNGMSEYLSSVDWYSLLTTNLTPDSLWQTFCEHLQFAVDLHVRTKQCRPQKADSKLPHRPRYPGDVRRAFLAKRSLWRKHRANPCNHTLSSEYHRASNLYRTLVRKYELQKEEKVVASSNPGAFYKFVNKKLSCTSGIGALRNENGDLVTD